MRTARKAFAICLILSFILFLLPYTEANAQGSDIPTVEEYAEDVTEEGETLTEASERLKREFTLSNLSERFVDGVKDSFFSYLSYFLTLIFIVVISGLFTSVKDKLKGAGTAESICTLALGSYTLALVAPLCENIERICVELCAMMVAMLPSVSGIYASSVGPATAAATHTGTATALSVIQATVTLIVIPGTKALIILAVSDAMTAFMDLSGFSGFIKGAIMWLLGLLASGISAVMYFQTVLSASADCLSARGLRFAAQRAIPIVGGVVSESLRVVNESLRLLKSVYGISGILVLLYFILPPIALVLVYRLFISLSGTIAGMLGFKNGQSFLREVLGAVNILLACVIVVAFIIVIILGIFIRSTGIS